MSFVTDDESRLSKIFGFLIKLYVSKMSLISDNLFFTTDRFNITCIQKL